MKTATPTGTRLRIERPDHVLLSEKSLEADGLILPSRVLEDASVRDHIARSAVDCVLIAVIGPRAERAHDSLDEALLKLAADPERVPSTTWHDADETGEEVWNMVEQTLRASEKTRPEIVFLTNAAADIDMTLRDAIALIDKELAGVYAPPAARP